MNNFLEDLINIFPKVYINQIDYKQIIDYLKEKKLFEIQLSLTDYENMVCFKNHIIICESLATLLYGNNYIENYGFNYLIINGKIFLIFNHKINVGILDKDNIFMPIAIINFNPQSKSLK